MATTTIDSLMIEINSSSSNAVSGIDRLSQSLDRLKNITKGSLGLTKVANQLNKVSASIKGIDTTTLGNIDKLVTALQPLSHMPKQNISSTLTQLKKIPTVFNDLNKVDMKGFSSKIQEVSTSLEPLARQMDRIGTGFSAFPSKLQKVANSTNALAKSNGGLGNSYANVWARFRMYYNSVKTSVNFIASSIKSINSYIENINLFNVSLGEFANEAQEYAETVGDLMGIDPSEWMRSQGIFMTLAKGFGVASDRAYTMSKNLTQLGYDISSFYNISIEDAMQKLESGLAGELEPLRRIGYDLSQARLEATALSLGIDKAVSSMTQAEKAELRYYAIMTQITDSHGDMARTLDAPANQLRILKAQIEQASRAIGSIFIPALNAILPYVIAGTKVIRILASQIATLFGFTMPEVDYSGLTSDFETSTDAVEDTTKAVKKLKNYTMGFDELNIIDTSTSDTLDEVAKGFDFELPEYDFVGDLTESRVNEIVENMKEWLGISGDINSWADLFDTKLGDILTKVGLIGAGILAWKVTKTFIDSITMLKNILSNPYYTLGISIILTIAGLASVFSGMKDAIKTQLDKFNFAEIIGGSLLTTGGLSMLVSKLVVWIGKTFTNPKVAFALAELGKNLGVSTTGALGAALGAGIAGIITGIPMYITGIWDAIKNGLKVLNSLLVGAGATAIGAGVGTIIGALGGPIGAGIGALIGLAVGLATDGVLAIYDALKNGIDWLSALLIPLGTKVLGAGIGAIIGSMGGPIGVGVGALIGVIVGLVLDVVLIIKQEGNVIANFFVALWKKIKTFMEPVAKWFNEKVVQPIVKFFQPVIDVVAPLFETCWNFIKGIWDKVATWFDTNVVRPIVNFFSPIVDWIATFFRGCWIIIQAVWVVASTWFNEHVIQPIVTFFSAMIEDIKLFFSNLWEAIKKVWKDVSTWFNTYVIKPVVGFFKLLWEDVSGFFKLLWEDIKKVWKDVSSWFDKTVIQPFLKGWNTAVEAIKKVFKTLWDGIKDDVAKTMNTVIYGIESAINGIIRGINKLVGGFNKVVEWAADIIGEDWGGLTVLKEVNLGRVTFAEGGFPNTGQMFIAREAGPEMVGSIGRRTAVVNNEQIVASVSAGVAEANSEQTLLLKEQNALLRALLEKESSVRIDGKDLTKSVEKYQRERGRVLITGGAY